MKPWRFSTIDIQTPSGAQSGPRRSLAGNEVAVLTGAVVGLLAACFPPEEQRLACDDVYPPGSFDYRALETLIAQDEIETSKGCLAAPCHTAETQRGGVRLDTPDLVFEELSTRPELYYETLATGYMPHDGVPWSDEDLKIFRSWYCGGAFPP